MCVCVHIFWALYKSTKKAFNSHPGTHDAYLTYSWFSNWFPTAVSL